MNNNDKRIKYLQSKIAELNKYKYFLLGCEIFFASNALLINNSAFNTILTITNATYLTKLIKDIEPLSKELEKLQKQEESKKKKLK